jgi:hypothetical protein
MTYYADLTPYSYLCDRVRAPDAPSPGPRELNVGWLDSGVPHSRGAPPADLAETLQRMRRTHRARQTRGFHLCPWCAPGLARPLDDCPRGSAEIRVPGDGVVYAAPELVAHYVEAHEYLPPAEFVRAVLGAGE